MSESEAISATTPDSSVSMLRGRMDVSGLSVTSTVRQQREEVKHKPRRTGWNDRVYGTTWTCECGRLPGRAATNTGPLNLDTIKTKQYLVHLLISRQKVTQEGCY